MRWMQVLPVQRSTAASFSMQLSLPVMTLPDATTRARTIICGNPHLRVVLKSPLLQSCRDRAQHEEQLRAIGD
jgi:hypothetical protein